MTSDSFWEALGERALVVTTSVNTLIKLASAVTSRLTATGAGVCVVAGKPELLRYFPLELLSAVRLVGVVEACAECTHVVAVEPENPGLLGTCSSKYVYVFTCKSKTRAPRGFRRVYVKRTASGDYLLAAPSVGVYARISISSGEIAVREGPGGLYGRALEALKSTMSLYGELSVKDAVRVLVHELGVGRAHARRLIEWLARSGYIRVVRGRVTLGYT
jgi:hypothetical protein